VLSEAPSRDTEIGFGESMPDDRILYLNRPKHALVARHPQTGAEEVILDLRAEGIQLRGGRYKFSSDGQTLAFTAFTQQQDQSWISAIAVKVPRTGPRHDVVQAKPGETVLFQDWTPDGQSLLFTRQTSATEPASLWRISMYGANPRPLGLSMVGLRDVNVRPDGKKITFTAGWPLKELWAMEHFLGPQ
jgi:Tol biopolymer transport system component